MDAENVLKEIANGVEMDYLRIPMHIQYKFNYMVNRKDYRIAYQMNIEESGACTKILDINGKRVYYKDRKELLTKLHPTHKEFDKDFKQYFENITSKIDMYEGENQNKYYNLEFDEKGDMEIVYYIENIVIDTKNSFSKTGEPIPPEETKKVKLRVEGKIEFYYYYMYFWINEKPAYRYLPKINFSRELVEKLLKNNKNPQIFIGQLCINDSIDKQDSLLVQDSSKYRLELEYSGEKIKININKLLLSIENNKLCANDKNNKYIHTEQFGKKNGENIEILQFGNIYATGDISEGGRKKVLQMEKDLELRWTQINESLKVEFISVPDILSCSFKIDLYSKGAKKTENALMVYDSSGIEKCYFSINSFITYVDIEKNPKDNKEFYFDSEEEIQFSTIISNGSLVLQFGKWKIIMDGESVKLTDSKTLEYHFPIFRLTLRELQRMIVKDDFYKMGFIRVNQLELVEVNSEFEKYNENNKMHEKEDEERKEITIKIDKLLSIIRKDNKRKTVKELKEDEKILNTELKDLVITDRIELLIDLFINSVKIYTEKHSINMEFTYFNEERYKIRFMPATDVEIKHECIVNRKRYFQYDTDPILEVVYDEQGNIIHGTEFTQNGLITLYQEEPMTEYGKIVYDKETGSPKYNDPVMAQGYRLDRLRRSGPVKAQYNSEINQWIYVFLYNPMAASEAITMGSFKINTSTNYQLDVNKISDIVAFIEIIDTIIDDTIVHLKIYRTHIEIIYKTKFLHGTNAYKISKSLSIRPWIEYSIEDLKKILNTVRSKRPDFVLSQIFIIESTNSKEHKKPFYVDLNLDIIGIEYEKDLLYKLSFDTILDIIRTYGKYRVGNQFIYRINDTIKNREISLREIELVEKIYENRSIKKILNIDTNNENKILGLGKSRDCLYLIAVIIVVVAIILIYIITKSLSYFSTNDSYTNDRLLFYI